MFYEVEKSIILTLEELGFEVVWFENKDLPLDYHGTRSRLKILRRLYFLFFAPEERYIKRQLEKTDNLYFDLLFSINGHVACPFLFKKLKKLNPDLHSILYLWDSLSMYSWEEESRLFDRVYTFDRRDSESYGWEYLPNFFINRGSYEDTENKYDLFFAGKFSPDRLRILDLIKDQLSDSDIKHFIKIVPSFKNTLHSKWVWVFLKMIRIRTTWIKNYLLNYEVIEGIVSRECIIYGNIKFEDVQKLLSGSNVILDLPFEEQSGYSHRLIEALVRGKKLITTNQGIKKEIFYNPDQIRVIEKDDPVIDLKWIKEKVGFKRNGYFDNLELKEWLKSIFKVEIA